MVNRSDIYVLCGLLARNGGWTYRTLASELFVSLAVVQRALDRAESAGLYSATRRTVHLANFEEFALHALRFVMPAKLGAIVPGVPAAWAAPPVSRYIRATGEELPPVWPAPRGPVRGQALQPLHEAAVDAVTESPQLGALLAVADSLRAGDLRVRSVAGDLLSRNLRGDAPPLRV